MRLFLKRLTYFFFPLLLMVIPLDYFLSTQLPKSRTACVGEYPVWNDLYNHNIQADLLIYGSSRAWVHIDPQMIEDSLQISSYNLGIDGHNFNMSHLRHKMAIDSKGDYPKYIIYSLDYQTLAKRKNLYNKGQFLPYVYADKRMQHFTNSYEGFDWYDYNLPLIRYAGMQTAMLYHALKGVVCADKMSIGRQKGFEARDEKWNDDLADAKKQMDYYNVKLDAVTVAEFDAFLTDCQSHGTKIIFVYTPEYIDGQQFVRNREELMSLFRSFAEKYSIRFLDYSSDSISYNRVNFYNANHMNMLGVARFNPQLVKDLKLVLRE